MQVPVSSEGTEVYLTPPNKQTIPAVSERTPVMKRLIVLMNYHMTISLKWTLFLSGLPGDSH